MSNEMSLAATLGRATGTRPSKRLLTDDQIPAVIYGQGVGPTSIQVDRRDLRHALSGPAGANALIRLSVDGVSHPTVIKEIQRDTKTAVAQIESGNQRASRGVDLASEAGTALGRITQSTEGLAGMVQSIAAAR